MSREFTKGELEIIIQALAYYYGSDDIFDLSEYDSALTKVANMIKSINPTSSS
jgi:hypothetical protein